MDKRIEAADILDVWVESGVKTVAIKFSICGGEFHKLFIEFPFDISKYADLSESLFGILGGIFLGQLCFAKKIIIHTKSMPGVEILLPIISNLYEIRSFRDKLPFMPLPEITLKQSSDVFNISISNKDLACLLWSAGLDSTLAVFLLQKNGYDVLPVHVKINEGAVVGENAAVDSMAKQLGLDLQVVNYVFDDYLKIAKNYSDVIDVFPLDNPVPHGRELILIPIAILTSLAFGATSICLGHEHNAWTREIEYLGRKIYRCDTQSEPANIVLQKFITNFVSKDIRLFSPIAPLSDFKKFELLAKMHPAILSDTLSCFWGNWCGQCQKCSLSWVLQKMLGINAIQFKMDPITSNEYLRRIVYEWNNKTLTNWAEHHYALSTIVRNNEERENEPDLLKYYRANVLPNIESSYDEIKSRLNKIYDVELLPSGFRFDF